MTKPDVVPVIIYLRHRAEPLQLDLLKSDYDGSGPDGEGLSDVMQRGPDVVSYRCINAQGEAKWVICG